jgi:anionic cell wall polymer biosynthesis LytR-Cps2A-Psr (LCP) family protein
LARTLDLNFGARPEHYFAINMQTFVRLVDALGGVEIDLPYAVDGRMPDQKTRTDLYFPAGPQTLSGRSALTLARLRIGTNADRITNQSRIVCALRDTALKPSNFARLPEIINAFQGAVQTNLSPQQISALACLAPQIPAGSIRFVSFPSETMTATRIYDPLFKKQVFIYQPDLALMRLYTTSFQRGDWPAEVTQSASQSSESQQESFSCP